MSFQYFPVCTVAEGKVRKDAECYSSSYHFAWVCLFDYTQEAKSLKIKKPGNNLMHKNRNTPGTEQVLQ